jgi:hypothetical protein
MLLQENGDALLLEDGGYLLLESSDAIVGGIAPEFRSAYVASTVPEMDTELPSASELTSTAPRP